jgi:hypothetical protein
MTTQPLHPSLTRLYARTGYVPSSRNRKRAFAHRLAHTSAFPRTQEEFPFRISRNCYFWRKNKYTEVQRTTKRAKKDKEFARTLARSLAPSKVRSIAAADAYIAAYPARCYAYTALGSPAKIIPRKYPANAHALPCGADEADALGVSVCKRGKDWTVEGSHRTSHSHTPGETTWKNGRAVGYTRAINTTTIRALAVMLSPALVRADLNGKLIAVTAPTGCAWSLDANGLRITRGPDDYHPEGIDFLCADPTAQMLVKLEANAATRRATALRALAENAANEGIFVCLADSIRAGNCRAGSESFAARHNLHRARHYGAIELLTLANGDSARVRLAITAAKYRHAADLSRGYSMLAEHVA